MSGPARRTSWTAEELLATAFPEPRWAVPGVVAEGLNLVVGPPKLGKSWLALNLCVSVATGGLALGKVSVEKGQALYLALEDNGRRLQSRLRMVLGEDDAPRGLRFETEWPSISDGCAERLADVLSGARDTRLVVVDVLAKVRGSAGGSSTNRYDADYAAMSALKRVGDEHGVALLVAHHTRKSSADDFVDEVSGTNGIAGAADAVLLMKRERTSVDATLSVTGRDVEEAEYALRFEPSMGTWHLLDEAPNVVRMSVQRQRILEAVRESEGLRPKQIAAEANVDHEVVKKLVVKMAEAGDLENDGTGRYFTPTPVPPVPSVPSAGVSGNGGNAGNGVIPFPRSPA